MGLSSSEAPAASLLSTLAKALQAESDQLKNARREITLFSGEYVGAFAEYYYYRFEIPEELPLRGVERASFMFSQLQPVTIEGKILGLDNQFLTVALPINFGSVLPEIKCSWNHEDHLKPIINALDVAVDNHPVVSALFHPEEPANAHPANIEPTFLPTTTQEQQDAIKKILNTRVAYVWGPIRSGKTHLLALTALNYLKAGKKVLMVAKTNDRVDQAVTQTISLSADLGVDLKAIGARVGLPSKLEAERLGSLSLEYEVGEQKGEKKKMFEERVALLQNYWRTKIHQSLHEDFYGKLSELRQRTNENRKQLDKVSDELKGHKETISREQHASMLEKLKKGFSKEEIGAAQKGLAEKQAQQKRLQAMQQALTTELMRMEAQAPIDSSELKEYQSAVKRLGELGGVKKVAEEVEAFIAVDERALLSSKRFVVTTAATILSDPRLRNNQFDLVVVDDAESVPLPHLAALALRATDRMVVAGDPYQLGPKSYSSSELAQTWLQRDIFLHIARTEHLHQLVEWSQRNAQWCIFLSSHVPTSVKLSSFVASVLFDDQLKLSASPEARGKIYFLDTSDMRSSCRQYIGKKRIIPYNDLQTKKTMELVKHALMQAHRGAVDIGVVVPFHGTSLHTKLQLRLQALRNVEVGTPQTFRGCRKKAVIFDTTMAGVDYTMRQIDDRKIGEHRIARLFNSIFSCVEEDLYILADMFHFKSVYKDRLFTKLLMLLQAQADPLLATAQTAKQFDELDWDARTQMLDHPQSGAVPTVGGVRSSRPATAQKADAELEVRMKMMARQQSQLVSTSARNFERETYLAAHRVLGMRKDVNLLSQLIGGDVLFRHSLGTEQASARLPLDVCRSEEDFRKSMERWNLLIYEMSGAGKSDLSFFAKQTPEASVRWDITNLRAYYSSTVEAVVEEGKHRVAVSVSKVFQESLGKSQPANPVEWSTAYLSFLGKMEGYLAWISEQLRK